MDWILLACLLWACHTLAEQQTIGLLMVIRQSYVAGVCSVAITTMGLLLSSGVLR